MAFIYETKVVLIVNKADVLWQWVTTFTVLRFMTMSNYFYRAPFYDNE